MATGKYPLKKDESATSRRTIHPEQRSHDVIDHQPHPAAIVRRLRANPAPFTAHDVMQLQRTVGNRAVTKLLSSTVVQRVPYAQAYGAGSTKSILNNSEGRASPVNGAVGHPRQHVGRWEKAQLYAEEQGKTKSVYVNTAAQDTAIASALNSAAGQAQLAQMDPPNPGAPTRKAIANVATEAADVKVIKAKIKKRSADDVIGPRPEGQIYPGEVKNWTNASGTATNATVIVDSMGTGRAGDIHIQTAYPVLD